MSEEKEIVYVETKQKNLGLQIFIGIILSFFVMGIIYFIIVRITLSRWGF